jgi:MFS family permease
VSDDRPTTERRVTFGEIFGIGEYRAIYSSTQLAWIGEYMTKAAVMALVFAQTGSVFAAAGAFAITYVPWLIGGPFLSALAERYRYKRVMIGCDVARALLIGLVAVPGVPLSVMLLLVFAATLLAAPGQAARSAMLPLVLTGERVVLGLAVNQSSAQATQVIGYFAGALISIIDPQVAVLCTAAFFALSAIILSYGVTDRPPAMLPEHRSHLLRETGEGFRMVFGTPALRVIAIIVFTSMLFSIVPEGLASGWASSLAENDTRQGLYQGLIMAANPLGYALGVLLIARLLMPTARRRLVPYLAVLAPLALVPALVSPPILGVIAMTMVSGLAMAGMTPTLNGLFVQALPNGFRARAFGVMNSGVQAIQGLAVLATGGLVTLAGGQERLPLVVGLWCLAGMLIMLVLAVRWPKPDYFVAAIVKAEAANRAAEAPAPAPAPEQRSAQVRPVPPADRRSPVPGTIDG